MTSDLVCARDDMMVQELAHLLQEHRITGAPVVDGSGRLVGVVSTSDIVLHNEVFGGAPVMESDYHRLSADSDALLDGLEIEDIPDLRVQDIMSTEVISACMDTPADELAKTMYIHRIHRIVIVEGDRLMGIVSTMDILRAMMEKRIA